MIVNVMAILMLFILIHPSQGIADNQKAGNSKKDIPLDKHKVHDFHEHENIASVTARDIEQYQILIGKVEANPNKLSHLNPRYPGVVRSIRADIGDSVRAGQILAKIDSNVGVQTFSLKANLSGKIVHRKLAVGEFVDESRLAFSIADLDDLWVHLTVRRSELKYFTKGREVKVVSRNKRHITTGKIFYISPIVDQHTMNATATLEIHNDHGHWKPGQYVEGYLVLGRKTADIAVPNSAIVTSKSGAKVYVKNSENEFKGRQITTGLSDLQYTAVLSGLRKGEEVFLQPESAAMNLVDNHDDHDDHDDHDVQAEEHKQ